MAEKFSVPELAALRSELLTGLTPRMPPSWSSFFWLDHGYGVSPEAARHAVSRVALMGNTLEVFQRELESIALVM